MLIFVKKAFDSLPGRQLGFIIHTCHCVPKRAVLIFDHGMSYFHLATQIIVLISHLEMSHALPFDRFPLSQALGWEMQTLTNPDNLPEVYVVLPAEKPLNTLKAGLYFLSL